MRYDEGVSDLSSKEKVSLVYLVLGIVIGMAVFLWVATWR
jgi:hypothetical protein